MMAHLKTSLKRLNAAEQLLRVEVPREHVSASYEVVYRDLQRTVRLPGFRKGKAPRDLVERHHGAQAREEVIRRLIGDTLNAAVKEHAVQSIGHVAVSEVKLDDQHGLSYQATVEVAPTFKLGRYKKLSVQRPAVVVTDADVEQVLHHLREAHAEAVPVDGQEQKETRLPALDDEFAKDVGLGSLDELKQRVRSDLTAQKEQQAQGQMRDALYDTLLSRMDFEVPRSLVERRAEQLKRDYLTQLLMQGVPETALVDRVKPVEAQMTAQAVKLVKLTFIIHAIAQAEGLHVTPEVLQQRLAPLAQRWQVSSDEAQQRLVREQLWDTWQQQVRHDITVEWLIGQAHIETASA